MNDRTLTSEYKKKEITLRIPKDDYIALKEHGERIGLNIAAMIQLAVAIKTSAFPSIR